MGSCSFFICLRSVEKSASVRKASPIRAFSFGGRASKSFTALENKTTLYAMSLEDLFKRGSARTRVLLFEAREFKRVLDVLKVALVHDGGDGNSTFFQSDALTVHDTLNNRAKINARLRDGHGS